MSVLHELHLLWLNNAWFLNFSWKDKRRIAVGITYLEYNYKKASHQLFIRKHTQIFIINPNRKVQVYCKVISNTSRSLYGWVLVLQQIYCQIASIQRRLY